MLEGNLKVLSLFDGISGCQQALKNLGIKCEYYASEVDKYAIQITQKNFPNTIQLGDVKNIKCTPNSQDETHIYMDADGLDKTRWFWKGETFDLLCGGSPCQDLSIAKKGRKGLEGERSGLFYEYVRILNEVKPKFFILENVASMSKESKELISKELFNIEPILINSSLLTAQQRKRLYWVGALQQDGTYKKVEIEQPQDKGILLKDILESGEGIEVINKGKEINKTIIKSHCLMARDYKGFGNQPMSAVIDSICVASRGRNIVDGKRQDIKGVKTEQRLEPNLSYKTNTLTSVQKDNLILQPIRIGHLNKGGQGDRIYSVEGKSVNLSANGGGRGAKTGLYKMDLPAGDYLIRSLTPIECERLQGFSHEYTNCVSKTQRLKALGNSFTVPVIEHILKAILYETK